VNKVNRSAFTLIEVVVAMGIMIFLMSIATRFFKFKKAEDNIQTVVKKINNIVFLTKQNAFISDTKFSIEIKRDGIAIFKLVTDSAGKGKREEFVSSYLKTKYDFPQNITTRSVYKDGKRMDEDRRGSVFVDFSKNGILPSIFVQLAIASEGGTEAKVTLQAQSFLGYFELLDGWVRE